MTRRGRGRINRAQRGMTFVEVLVASLILSVSLAGMVSMWYFSYNMTTLTDNEGIGYNLGRQAMEVIRTEGFVFTPEGQTLTYYNNNEAVVTATDTTRSLLLTTNVVSSSVTSGTAGVSGAVPADGALRTVTLTVQRTRDSRVVYSTNTYLVKYGL